MKIKTKKFNVTTKLGVEKMRSFIDSLGNRFIDDVYGDTLNQIIVSYYV